MRNFSKVMAWLGLLLMLVGIGLAAKASLDIYGNLQPKNSVPAINPHPWIWVAVAVALLGGFLAGLGLGMSSKYRALALVDTQPPGTASPAPPAKPAARPTTTAGPTDSGTVGPPTG